MQDLKNLINVSKNLKIRGSIFKEKLGNFLKKESSRKVLVKQGKRIIIEIPFSVGLGSAAAAIIINAPITAIAALLALSSDVKFQIQKEKENLPNP